MQSHDVIVKAAEGAVLGRTRQHVRRGVGDGGGVSMDLSQAFFRKVTGIADLS